LYIWYIFGKLFSRSTFASQIVPVWLYLEPFKSYKFLKVSEMPNTAHPSPFLDPHIWIFYIATKRGADTSGTQLYHRAKFKPIGCTDAETSVPKEKNTLN